MMDRILHYLVKLVAAFIGFLVGVIVLVAFSPVWAGMGLLGFQILFWLNTGGWPSFRLTDGIDLIAADLGLMNQLNDLSGFGESLWNVLNVIPLSVFLIIAGLLLSAAIASLYDGLRDRLRQVKEETSEGDFMPIQVSFATTRPSIHHPIQYDDTARPPQHYPPGIEEPSSNPLLESQESRIQ